MIFSVKHDLYKPLLASYTQVVLLFSYKKISEQSAVLFLGRAIAPFTHFQVWWPSKIKEVRHIGRTYKNSLDR